jgi:hypothetical protein
MASATKYFKTYLPIFLFSFTTVSCDSARIHIIYYGEQRQPTTKVTEVISVNSWVYFMGFGGILPPFKGSVLQKFNRKY